jgi:hypothetical protein
MGGSAKKQTVGYRYAPDSGVLMTTGERPSADALAAQVWLDAGTGYAPDESMSFAPTAPLAAEVSDDPNARVLAVSSWVGLDEVEIGSLAAIGDELVRSDGVSETTVSVGRGCLDTVPIEHAAGTPVICWQAHDSLSAQSFEAGESVRVKLLPETGFGTLPLVAAPEDAVTFASRAIRPLSPGNLKADGLFLSPVAAKAMTLSWAHRDRLAQTSAVFDDYTAPSIGPEPGVHYEVRIHWVDPGTGETVEPAAAAIDVGQAPGYVLSEADYPLPPLGVEQAAIRVRAVRDGYNDRGSREYRVAIEGKVHVTGQELLLDCRGPGVDIVRQELILHFVPPALGVVHQELAVLLEPLGWTAMSVANHGFETGDLSGWSVLGDPAWEVTSSLPSSGTPPPAGSYVVRPVQNGDQRRHELQQDVDVSAESVRIDTGQALARLRAAITGYDIGNDVGRLGLAFLDAGSALIGAIESPPYSNRRTWPLLAGELTAPVPAGTRQIRLRLIAEPGLGPHVDVYFDTIRLEIGSS